MIKRKLKHWHLSDFKETAKFMYIVLDENFHKKFYLTAIEVAGGQRKLAKKLGFYSSRINNYLHQNRRPSLNSIIKISQFLVNSGKSDFNMGEIEKRVIKIKVNGQPVSISPKFPIKLDENLVRIISHLLGDGGINRCFDPHYSNGDETMLNNFKKYMKKVFGCNASREHGSGKKKQIWYPRIVGKMLIEMFGSFSFGKSPKYVPNIILKLDKDMKSKFLNSLYGDEGSTSSWQVGLYQGRKNLEILNQAKLLLEELNIKSNNILKVKGKHIMIDPHTKKEYQADEVYAIFISGYRNLIKFKNIVGFPKDSIKIKNFLKMLEEKYASKAEHGNVGGSENLFYA